MNARMAGLALALGATVLVAGDALAAGRGGARKKAQTIELTRPAGAPDADAAGTVKITHGAKGDRTTIDLSHLNGRTRYEVHDAASGALLGTVRTNRRGRGTFDLTRSLAKAASANGSDAGGVGNVQIVDPTTGEPVLTGDVTPDPVLPQFGYADYSDDAGNSADAFLSSDPDNGVESFSFEFFPVADPNAATFSYYDMNLDTSNGDTLPLGAAGVAELAGRRFEVVAPDGTVVLDDTLPDLQTFDCPVSGDGSTGDWGGDWGGQWNGDWTGSWGGDWTSGGTGDWGSWTGDPSAFDPNGHANAARHGHAKAKRGRGARAAAADGYSLLIADADGVLQSAGLLNEETFDASVDCPVFDPGQYGDFGGGDVFGIVILLPLDGLFDGSFDWTTLFGDLFGGAAGDPTASGSAARLQRR